MVSPRAPCFAIQHTILVLVLPISCKGQHTFLLQAQNYAADGIAVVSDDELKEMYALATTAVDDETD